MKKKVKIRFPLFCSNFLDIIVHVFLCHKLLPFAQGKNIFLLSKDYDRQY